MHIVNAKFELMSDGSNRKHKVDYVLFLLPKGLII